MLAAIRRHVFPLHALAGEKTSTHLPRIAIATTTYVTKKLGKITAEPNFISNAGEVGLAAKISGKSTAVAGRSMP